MLPLPFNPFAVRKGVYYGLDLTRLARDFWRLEAMHAEGRLPTITWKAHQRGSAWGSAWTGFARGMPGRITMRLGPGAHLGANALDKAAEVLLHELVHCSLPHGESHGELFCRRLVGAAREAFEIRLDTAAMLALKARPGRIRAYVIDDAITEAMVAAGVGARLLGATRPAPALPTTATSDRFEQLALLSA